MFICMLEKWRDLWFVVVINCFVDGGMNVYVIVEGWVEDEKCVSKCSLILFF